MPSHSSGGDHTDPQPQRFSLVGNTTPGTTSTGEESVFAL